MNIWAGIGRLTSNPARYETVNGKVIAKYSIAINRIGAEKVDYVNCTSFDKQAENIMKYLSKGSLVSVLGKLQTSKYYDDRSQKNIVSTNVIVDNIQFLDNKKRDTSSQMNYENSEFSKMKTKTDYKGDLYITDDDLPF